MNFCLVYAEKTFGYRSIRKTLCIENKEFNTLLIKDNISILYFSKSRYHENAAVFMAYGVLYHQDVYIIYTFPLKNKLGFGVNS